MKKASLIIALIFLLQMFTFVFADGYEIGDDIGDVLSTDIIAQINSYDIPSFNVDNSTAIKASDLKGYGFGVSWDGSKREVHIERNDLKSFEPIQISKQANITIGTKLGDVLYTDIKAYLGDTLIQSYNMNGNTLILFKELKKFGEVSWDNINRIAGLTLNDNNTNSIFEDPALEAVVREELGKQSGTLTQSDLDAINYLYIYDTEIKSLKGIEYLKNLYSLYIYNCNINDISILSKLSKLKYLSINKGSVSDISPISEAVQLESLELSYCEISDIKPLASLTRLTTLNLNGNNISDISPLDKLINIYSLRLSGNDITNINALKNLTSLRYLDISYNEVEEISAINNLVSLEQLNISDNKIKSINKISSLEKLISLYADDNKIRDISSLNGLSQLEELYMDGNPIEDLSIIDSMSGLKSFRAFYEEDLKKANAVLKKVKEILASEIKAGMSDYDKELALHDYVVNNSKYDYDNYLNDTIPDDSYWPYGLLINKTGVCNAYAYTMKILLGMVDIECMIITGTGNGGAHAWNLVKLGGDYYHLDATWDDPIYYKDGKLTDFLSHDYFNITDNKMSQDHDWYKSGYPKCDSVLYSYDFISYWNNNDIPIGTVNYISGKIYLPNNDTAPEGGMEIVIDAGTATKDNWYNDFHQGCKVVIPEGESSAEYSIPVIPNSIGYNLSYYINHGAMEGYMAHIYFTSDSTGINSDMPRVIVDEDITIDVEMYKGILIKGRVTIPQNVSLDENKIRIYVNAAEIISESNYKTNYSAYNFIELDKDNSSGEFTIAVSNKVNTYILSFNIYVNDEYKETQYYSDNGCTADSDMTKLITTDKNPAIVNAVIDLE